MGQGYSVLHPQAGSAGIDTPELADLEYERTLGGPRFLKTIRGRHKNGVVVAKVFTKPYAGLSLKEHVQSLIQERRSLADVPNALAYHRILETSTSGYVVRQFIHSSLYDRTSTNPPLEDIERKWIAFQLLCAVRDCHARNVYHGDIKLENMLVTTWNWLYLTDFSAALKPATLPEDNPTEFSMFYDTTSRRICYLAPERFKSTDSEASPPLNWSMDMFSVGCVIAELFTEKPTFTLSQLFRYRRGEYDPIHASINNIKDESIREMVIKLLSLDPDARFAAEECLNFWRGKAFPDYFYNFLHQYMHLVTDPTSGRKPVVAGKRNSGESDDRIDRIYFDFDKISYSLGFDTDDEIQTKSVLSRPSTLGLDLFPLLVDIPNNRHLASNRANTSSDNGALLFSNIVIASLRSAARSNSRARGCDLLLALGERLTDEAKLDRVLPYAMALLEDEVVAVRLAALRTITQLLSLVNVLSPMNAFIFPRYVLPRLQKFISSPAFLKSSPVRATYATCLASLAHTASRFLDMTQALRADGSLPSTDPEAEDDVAAYAAYQTSYDVTREELIQQIEAQTKVFLTDDDPTVRRAFLGSVASLCVFFGDALASDLILTHLNTYLNDQDWTLKCAFFESIVGVAAFIGPASLEDFILPLMIQALTDPEETVTERVIRSLSSMAHLGLFQRWIVLELLWVVTRFAFHPNPWIREASAQFIAVAVSQLSEADYKSLVEPLIMPILKIKSADMVELGLLDALKKPFPRGALDMAKVWVGKADKGSFWKPAQQARSFSFDANNNRSQMDFYRGADTRPLSRSLKHEEDEQWLNRMRNAGLRTEDELKLVALRDYIWRNARRSDKETSDSLDSPYNHIASLTAMKVPLQNVLFDDDLRYYDQIVTQAETVKASQPVPNRTLADALSDAVFSQDTGPDGNQQTDNGRTTLGEVGRKPSDSDVSQMHRNTAHVEGAAAVSKADGRLAAPAGRPEANKTYQLSSSPSSQLSGSSRGHNHSLRHKTSAVNLIRRAESNSKANAEIGTDSINATGKIDVPSGYSSRRATPQPGSIPQSPRPRLQGAHSYTGGDPTVTGYLDTMYTANFPLDVAEFGPLIQPLKRAAITTSGQQLTPGRWKPQGQLVAAIGEHQALVSCIAVAPDHVFFITGSDDGTVRIWDTARLERNVAHRSRQFHRHPSGARITGLCFVESTHSFISTAADGSLNVVKVDVSESAGALKYGRLQVMRDWALPSRGDATECALSVQHFRLEGQSICVFVTNLSRVIALDLRSMDSIYELQNPVEHGTPTSFCIHRRRQWLLIGTSHGVLDLWDIRFRLRLRSWTFRNPSKITHMALHPGRKSMHRMRVCISGGTSPDHVSVWDLEKLVCTELFHTVTENNVPKVSARDLELLSLDDEKAEAQLTRIVGSVSRDSALSQSSSPSHSAVRSFNLAMHVTDDNTDARHAFLITAGPDWKLRFWDPDRLANSSIVNGATASDAQAVFSANLIGADTRVYTQSEYNADDQISLAASTTAAGKASKAVKSSSGTGSAGKRDRNAGASVPSGKLSRYDVIRASAQQLLKGHKDEVTCVALLEKPFGMVVSADRSGMVYIFQ